MVTVILYVKLCEQKNDTELHILSASNYTDFSTFIQNKYGLWKITLTVQIVQIVHVL